MAAAMYFYNKVCVGVCVSENEQLLFSFGFVMQCLIDTLSVKKGKKKIKQKTK